MKVLGLVPLTVMLVVVMLINADEQPRPAAPVSAAPVSAAPPCAGVVGTVAPGDYYTKRAALLKQLVLLQEAIIELDRAQVGMQHFGNEYHFKEKK